MIEEAMQRGAKSILVLCHDVQQSWSEFASHFQFVQAAGGLVTNRENKILFIYRLEKWDLPKGKVEDGEKVLEGAVREVEEECSLDQLKVDSEFYETWHTYMQDGVSVIKSTRWFLMRYAGNAVPKPQLKEGITKAVWLGLEDMDIVRSNTYPSVIDVVEAYLGLLAGK